jgi:membrane fusion protein (multidrug efflux system)
MISRISCLLVLGAFFLYSCGSKTEEGAGPGAGGPGGQAQGGRSGGEGRQGGGEARQGGGGERGGQGGGQGRQGAGGPGGAGGRGGRGPSGPISVETFVVQPQIISERLEVPGTLFPNEETIIKSEVNGRIVEINFQEGTTVQKGALLVKLFDRDLQATYSKLRVQLDIAKKTAERQKELLAINGISQQDYDLLSLSVDNLNADIESIKISIGKTEIRAPYTGKIGLRNVSMGAYISSADVITTLRQVDALKLEFSIPEKYAAEMAKGHKVQFVVDGGRGPHNATVSATEGSVELTTRTLRVRALVTEKSSDLVPGAFARINLQLGQNNGALMIPTQAIIPGARNKQVILAKRDSAFFVIVKTGVRDSSYVEILDGLKRGDTVVTTGVMVVRPKSKIKITKVNRYQ